MSMESLRDYPEDIARLRPHFKRHRPAITDEQVATAWEDYSEVIWAAGWMRLPDSDEELSKQVAVAVARAGWTDFDGEVEK